MNKSYVWAAGLAGALAVAVLGGLVLAGLATYYYLAPTLPAVAELRDVRMQVPLRVYTRDGRLLAQIGEQRRIPVRFEEIPKPLVEAFLAAEDDRFFQHGGIDTPGLLRAVLVTAATGEARQGGSTITMQLARNMFLTPEKRIRRKLREIFLALRIEHEFSKEEILTLYLNKIFLGQRAYGVAAAAEVYYGKQLPALSLPEIATIAGLPKAPSEVNPIANPERARQRRAYVLRRMVDKGYISDAQQADAAAAPIETQEHGPRVEVDAPYVAEMVRAEFAQTYGEDVYTAGYRVITTLDSRLQRAADWGLRSALIEYDRRHGWRGPLAQGPVPADPRAVDAALVRFAPAGGLVPALVTKVAEKSASVQVRGGRALELGWEPGLAWARRADARGNLAPPPKNAGEILAAGDVVYVLPAGRGSAYLAQVPAVQGAFISLDPQDGAITALSGGFDFYDARSNGRFNRAIQAKRQPGSSFKPFVYSGALEGGFTAASVILDAPVVIEGANMEEEWRPENDSGKFYGPTRLRDALARSRNLVSIRILRTLGVEYARDYATRFGFAKDSLPANLTLALGTAQLTPLEMTTAYAVFANGGYRVQSYLVDRVEDANGKTLFEAAPLLACRECETPAGVVAGAPAAGSSGPLDAAATADAATPRAVEDAASTATGPAPATAGANEPGVTRLAELPGGLPAIAAKRRAPLAISGANAYLMTDIMRDVIRRGTATKALALKRSDIAGKTGTTNDHRDTWFAGFNPSLVAATWIGFDQERTLGAGEEGGRTALPAWIYFMSEALAGQPERRVPQPLGIVSARISPSTGELASPGDPDAIFEFFLAGHLPGDGTIPTDASGTGHRPAQGSQSDDPIF